ncbi:MAG: von Willebrand factor type A domain-containing protein [Ferruginibacter sp.]|nr:von Willebrand factor type A domain-containing protein [Cytophagales bacterium]
MSKFLSILTCVLFSWLAAGPAEKRTITGTVVAANDGSVLPGVSVVLKGTRTNVATDGQGTYALTVPDEGATLVFSFIGFVTQEIKAGKRTRIDVKMQVDARQLSELVVTGYGVQRKRMATGSVAAAPSSRPERKAARVNTETLADEAEAPAPPAADQPRPVHNTEEYDAIHENPFLAPARHPLSTFSIDVDAASYGNVRRFLRNGQAPPRDAVRIEEMVNYFRYDYSPPTGEAPFAVHTELAECPWAPAHQLLHIGLRGKVIPTENLPPSNLVFLIDVSGSMDEPEKLPLLQAAFRLLTEQLRAQDRVAIVVYAGAAGLVLPATSGSQKEKILAAIDGLAAGGSTAGGEGIRLAYQIAEQNFRPGGNNRVILATDGDFNVGVSSNAEMERLVAQKRESADGRPNVFLTVLGFGMGNYKDSKMEILADKGNGNYAYIDTILEAKKVLVNEFGGTLFTIAKDVKLQIEFNPAKVRAYRLIGYENRALRSEDFNDDRKDAGELGSGHTVTALYEIVPANPTVEFKLLGSVDSLKYQQNRVNPRAHQSGELLTLKLRYKEPDGNGSRLIETTVTDGAKNGLQTSDNFRFSAAVAAFGMLLRDSEFKGKATYADVLRLAEGARGRDAEGYRVEFINLVKSTRLLAKK